MEGSCCKSESSLITNCCSKDLFLDRYNTKFPPSDYGTTECLPNDSNSAHWFSQNGRTFDMNSEFAFNATSILTPTTTNMFLPGSFCCKPSLVVVPSDNISTACGSLYWEANASNNSNNSNRNNTNSSTELRSSSPFNLENSILSSWGLADCRTSTKEAQIHLMEIHTKEAKWDEYLHNPMLMLPSLQNQAPESLCNEIKPPMHLAPDTLGFGAILPLTKQQEPSQTSNIFSKDIQKLRAAFGNM